MPWLRLSLRRLRDERVPTAALAALVLVTAFVFAVAPRLLTRVADDSVHLELSRASGFDRNVQLVQETRLVDPQAPLDLVDKTGTEFASAIPSSVQALFNGSDYVIDSVRWRIRAPTSDPAFVRLRVQQHVAEHITYVEGRAPTGTTTPYAVPNAPAGTPPSSTLEVALSTATAKALDLKVGQTVPLEVDPSDALAGRAEGAEKIGMKLVGTFDVPAPKDPYWLDDPAIEHIIIRSLGSETKFLDATAVL
ncbi:MAG: hypothetical protein ACJ77B_03310, partial [Chloroflexota bacterium]